MLLDEMGSRPTGCRPSGNFPFMVISCTRTLSASVWYFCSGMSYEYTPHNKGNMHIHAVSVHFDFVRVIACACVCVFVCVCVCVYDTCVKHCLSVKKENKLSPKSRASLKIHYGWYSRKVTNFSEWLSWNLSYLFYGKLHVNPFITF